MNQDQQKQVDDNFSVFQKKLDSGVIPEDKYGFFALMRNGEIVGYYTTWEDANAAGLLAFTDQLFSIQEVTDKVVELGFFTYAIV